MPTTNATRIGNYSLFCEAHVAIADAVTQLIAKDGTALLRDLVQGYFDRRAESCGCSSSINFKTDEALREQRLGGFDSLALPPCRRAGYGASRD